MHTMAKKTIAAVERRFEAFLSVYSRKMLSLLYDEKEEGVGLGRNDTSPQRKYEVYRDVKATAEIFVR